MSRTELQSELQIAAEHDASVPVNVSGDVETGRNGAERHERAPVADGALLQLRASEIVLDEVTNIRLGPESVDEDQRINELAASIKDQGQIQPVVVRPYTLNPNGPGSYLLIAGRRRVRACMLLDIPILAVLSEKDDDEAYHSALLENIQREQLSPISLAMNMQLIRMKNDWHGKKGTKLIAKYLHISNAKVTTYEQLLDLPDDVQARVHSGDLAVDAALELANVDTTVASRDEILTDAQQIASLEQGQATAKEQGISDATYQDPSSDEALAEEPTKGTRSKKPKVSRKHVLAAARAKDALKVKKSRTKGDFITLFTRLSGPAYPPVMIEFATCLIDQWATDKIGDKAMVQRWNAISDAIPAKTKKAQEQKNSSKQSKQAKTAKA